MDLDRPLPELQKKRQPGCPDHPVFWSLKEWFLFLQQHSKLFHRCTNTFYGTLTGTYLIFQPESECLIIVRNNLLIFCRHYHPWKPHSSMLVSYWISCPLSIWKTFIAHNRAPWPWLQKSGAYYQGNIKNFQNIAWFIMIRKVFHVIFIKCNNWQNRIPLHLATMTVSSVADTHRISPS